MESMLLLQTMLTALIGMQLHILEAILVQGMEIYTSMVKLIIHQYGTEH